MSDALEYLFYFALLAGGIWLLVHTFKKEQGQKDRVLELLKDRGLKAPVTLRASGVTLAQDAGSGRTLIAKTEELIFTELTVDRLLSVELKEDGTTIQHASRPRQVGGAVVGGLLAGTAGAVVGGLGAKGRQRDRVNRVDLRLVLSDPTNSTIVLTLLNVPGNGVERNSGAHQSAEFKANEWLGRLKRILKQELPSEKTTPTTATHSGNSPSTPQDANVVDSLAKLVKMLEAGYLTKEEFESQKARIIRNSS